MYCFKSLGETLAFTCLKAARKSFIPTDGTYNYQVVVAWKKIGHECDLKHRKSNVRLDTISTELLQVAIFGLGPWRPLDKGLPHQPQKILKVKTVLDSSVVKKGNFGCLQNPPSDFAAIVSRSSGVRLCFCCLIRRSTISLLAFSHGNGT